MKRLSAFIALLLLLALLLSGCGKDANYTDASKLADNNQGASLRQSAPLEVATNAPATALDLPAGYDPASEEDTGAPYAGGVYDTMGNAVYAGATPIPINPIDMPTPTPRPDLTFTYGDYSADKLGLTFKSIVGYDIDDSMSDTYVLTEPYAQQKDGYSCVITLQITAVTSNYTTNDVKTDLKKYLENLEDAGSYSKWDTYTAASKTLMEGKGWYNNYRAETYDGNVIRGRVHMALISNNRLLTLHITCPGWYNSSFMKAYDQIRDSIKAK